MNSQFKLDCLSILKQSDKVYSHSLIEIIDGAREVNHVWFVFKDIRGECLYKATCSWFPHLSYILHDLEIKQVEIKQKKVVVYE